MKKSKSIQDEWLNDLVDAAESAVIGYEKYLKDELNYLELARIMKNLRSFLPIATGFTGEFKETDSAI